MGQKGPSRGECRGVEIFFLLILVVVPWDWTFIETCSVPPPALCTWTMSVRPTLRIKGKKFNVHTLFLGRQPPPLLTTMTPSFCRLTAEGVHSEDIDHTLKTSTTLWLTLVILEYFHPMRVRGPAGCCLANKSTVMSLSQFVWYPILWESKFCSKMILSLNWLKVMVFRETTWIKGVSKHVISPLKRNCRLITCFNCHGCNLPVGKAWDVRKVREMW